MKTSISTRIQGLLLYICNYKNKISPSFTLIELSVALSVIGILSAVGITAYKATNPELKKDLKKIKIIEDKLQEFFNVNGRLPFPANPAENISNTNYLTEAIYRNVYNATKERYKASATSFMTDGNTTYNTCATKSTHCNSGDFVVWGVIPTRTLGLPDDYAYDSQGHNFEYITHSAVAYKNNDAFDNGTKSNYTTNNNAGYDVYFSNGATIPLEKLSIYNNKSNKQIQTTANNTAYVIMSKGKTNQCFFNTRASTSVNSTNPTGNLLKNCVSNYTNDSTTERTIYQGYSKDFDNIVKYKTLNDVIYAKANAEEAKNELTQGRIVSYQPRDDTNLQTASKNLIGAINELRAENEALKAKIYPVGSIYISVNSTSPATLFGGTWVQITGRFLLASTTSKTTGGASSSSVGGTLTRTKNVSVSINGTTLSVSQMPSHSHGGYTGFAGKHKHISPYRETAYNGTHRAPFGAPRQVFNSIDNSIKLPKDSIVGSGSLDSNNSYLLTSQPYTYDDGWGFDAIDELNDTSYNTNIWLNRKAADLIDFKGNHRHTIMSEGGGLAHTHSASITQPEFSLSGSSINIMPPYFTVYVWYRTA